jgi:hypothetical protein
MAARVSDPELLGDLPCSLCKLCLEVWRPIRRARQVVPNCIRLTLHVCLVPPGETPHQESSCSLPSFNTSPLNQNPSRLDPKVTWEGPFVADDNKRAAEYRRRAAQARRMADAARTRSERADLIQVEKGWLRQAANEEAERWAPSQGKPHRGCRANDQD